MLLLLILLALAAAIPAAIAGAKGRSRAGFYLFGLCFFVPALVVALLITPDEATLAQRERLVGRRMTTVGQPSAPSQAGRSLESRLAQLGRLRDDGVLTDQEHAKARSQLIDRHFGATS